MKWLTSLHVDGADEVDQPDVERVGVDEDVVRFDAAVDDPRLVDLVQGRGQPQAMVKKSLKGSR